MSLPLPDLDDRRWADLVEQGRALIPLYAPEWTDHNASDPGITLMELLAWIAEGDIYRLNRITDRQKRALLRLLHVRPSPPRPAALACELRVTGASPVRLPDGVDCEGQALDGRPIHFQSTAPLDVVAAELRAVQRADAGGFTNLTTAWTRKDPIAAFGDDPVPGAALYLGFDASLPADAWTTLYFLVAGERARPAERRRLLADRGADGLPPHHGAHVTWEYLASGVGGDRWLPLEAADDTRSLTLSGALRLRPSGPIAVRAIGRVVRPLAYVRCRFADGAFDEAPALDRIFVNALTLVQASPVWQTWTIAAGAVVTGTPTAGQPARLNLEIRGGAITALTVDGGPGPEPAFLVLGYTAPTAVADGTLVVQAALAGSGTGEPEQTITIGPRPIVEETFRLFSLEGQAWRPWDRVDDFAASTRAAAHFRLDPTSGAITFGDGEHGRTPPQGSLLVARYDTTAAEAGAGRVTTVADSPRNRARLSDPGAIARLSVAAQAVVEAGAAAETLSHATGRAIDAREASRRAVTPADVEALALDTPGTRIARVAVRPNLYPGLDCVAAPGIVTAIVLPSLPKDRPVPGPGLLREVSRRLERRRTIGTRIVVTGASYLALAVHAQVKAFDGIDRTRLRGAVADALDAFFHPLRGGPDGTGWPLGRDVFRAEVMQVIDETAGVDHVLSLELRAGGCGPTCGNVCLRPTWLVAAGAHQIEVL
jgi:predicted phage baseplate assembly protein